jgi:hypothetical protein
MTEKTVEKPKFKVQISIKGKSAIIYRTGMPFIADTTDNAIQWLSDNSYEPKDIEVIGEKPESWDKVFPAPIPSQESLK